jgi:hypothetical protein
LLIMNEFHQVTPAKNARPRGGHAFAAGHVEASSDGQAAAGLWAARLSAILGLVMTAGNIHP